MLCGPRAGLHRDRRLSLYGFDRLTTVWILLNGHSYVDYTCLPVSIHDLTIQICGEQVFADGVPNLPRLRSVLILHWPFRGRASTQTIQSWLNFASGLVMNSPRMRELYLPEYALDLIQPFLAQHEVTRRWTFGPEPLHLRLPCLF